MLPRSSAESCNAATRNKTAATLRLSRGCPAKTSVLEFHGETPFGGECRGRQAIRAWFDQVALDFGRLSLTAHDVAVSGPPWNLRVVVRFNDRYDLISGDTLTNHGFQFLRIAWERSRRIAYSWTSESWRRRWR
jgi:SnoaL-like domain